MDFEEKQFDYREASMKLAPFAIFFGLSDF